MMVTVDLGREVVGEELLTVLEKAAQASGQASLQSNEYDKETTLLLHQDGETLREVVRGRFLPEITIPYIAYERWPFKSESVCIKLQDPQGYSFFYENKYRKVKVWVCIKGRRKKLVALITPPLVCIPVIGWLLLGAIFETPSPRDLPQEHRKEVERLWTDYFKKVSELLHSSSTISSSDSHPSSSSDSYDVQSA